jgi:hypothetical protein
MEFNCEPEQNETVRREPQLFQLCRSVHFVIIGSLSTLSSIEADAFRRCWNLMTIRIPSSVKFLRAFCFSGCEKLSTLSFYPGSNLQCVPREAFALCSALKSLLIPSSVKRLEEECFASCYQLGSSPFPIDSQVVRIEKCAFSGCSALGWIFLPSSVEFVGELCFQDCDSLSVLEFRCPSHLRELRDLPPQLSGAVDVPDSVEVLSFHHGSKPSCNRVLLFGQNSRLTQISLIIKSDKLPARGQSFMQFSSRSLKIFRSNLESKPGLVACESTTFPRPYGRTRLPRLG